MTQSSTHLATLISTFEPDLPTFQSAFFSALESAQFVTYQPHRTAHLTTFDPDLSAKYSTHIDTHIHLQTHHETHYRCAFVLSCTYNKSFENPFHCAHCRSLSISNR